MKLRPYQEETISEVYDYIASKKGNAPLAVIPTGGGKTAVYNSMMRDMMLDQDTNVMMVTHNKELIKQGAQSFLRFMPEADVSIYSAGLGTKKLTGRAIFAGIQSIHKKAYDCPRIDVCFIDEAHLVSPNGSTMYQSFLSDLKVCNKKIKLIGLTATPFRLSSGLLHEGDNAIFDGIAHEVKILHLMQEGYLTRIVAKPPSASIDTSGVGKRGGEWIESQLAIAASDEALIKQSVSEVVHYGKDRKRWIIFACNISHAELLKGEYERQGVRAEVVSSKHKDSDEKMLAHRRGEFKALINVDKLTTGYDDPYIDLLAVKRSTMSVGLFIQIVGRGTRVVYAKGMPIDTREQRLAAIAAGPKPDCLLMDFGNNITTHGFIDQIDVTKKRSKGEGGGDAPQKVCPSCEEYIPASARICPNCDHYFKPPAPNHDHMSYSGAVTSDQVKDEWIDVDDVTYERWKKDGKPDSMRVTYICGMTRISEWLCPDHGGYAASRYEARKSALKAFAGSTDAALIECERWVKPSRIKVRPDGKYHQIMQLDYSGRKENEKSNFEKSEEEWIRQLAEDFM